MIIMDPLQNDTATNETLVDGAEVEFRFSDYNQRVVLASIYFIISILGCVGNAMVIVAVCLARRLRTITNVFVVSLSIADLLTCLALPFNAVNLLDADLGSSMLPEWICKAVALVLYVCGGCSLYTLAAIAINRYILITRPVRTYRSLYSRCKTAGMVTATWLVPFLVAFFPPLFGLGELGYAEKYGSCTHKTSNPLSHVYSIVQAVIFYPGPMTIIIVCYVKIFKYVKQHCKRLMCSQTEGSVSSLRKSNADTESNPKDSYKLKRPSTSRKQIDITKNLFCVVLAFVICVSPFGIALMIPPSDPFIPWAAAILVLNSCINPIIYATKHPHFREVFRLMLRCQCSKIRPKNSLVRQNVIRRR
ncbi:melatonin receptor type 1B-A-like [Patiria miniata]|uniref:G-protein coupled receptors family 1 profile domain-containing protein n=1 Tax=Patiria miniata TaxID=46514 RepID=A0A913YZQ2_PATMI|nr:melatonin receptor type 1B-A-like [Patiria miniata]